MKHICTKFVAMLLVIAMIAGVLPFAFRQTSARSRM